VTLARLCHGGAKSSDDNFAKSLEGDYRPEHLFALRQSLPAFHHYQQIIVEVDQEIRVFSARLHKFLAGFRLLHRSTFCISSRCRRGNGS
jgi:transposase